MRGGKPVRETLFERPLEPAFADLLPVALGLVVELLLHDGLLRNCHGCPPCERRTGHTGRAVVQITRGAWLAFPYQGSRISDQQSGVVINAVSRLLTLITDGWIVLELK